jgi:D-alanyl-D-alanine carboxypeptidase
VPELQPGVAFHYSNVGFLLLGTAVAAVTGRPFTDVVAEGVLAPAGMAASIARVTNDDRARLATGYWSARSDRPWLPGDALEPSPFLEVAGADGNTAATIGDLAAFARLLLRRAEGVLPSALFDVMIGRTGPGGEEVLALSGVPASSISRYGLGVNVEVVEGRTVLTHGGGMVGYASFLHADLDRGRAVVVVSNANGDSPVAEAIARVIAAEADGSVLDPARWVASGKGLPRAALPSMVGEFGDMTIRAEPDIDGGIALTVTLAGETHPLFWSWGERVLTRHPLLRTFGLRFERGRWMSGSTVFGTLPASIDPDLESLCGRYRSYSPWFPEFRIVQRDGVLRLSMPGGVEAPGEDLPLIRLSDDYYRIGEAVSLPGRLRFGPLVAGVATWVDRDGCRYSRAFTS